MQSAAGWGDLEASQLTVAVTLLAAGTAVIRGGATETIRTGRRWGGGGGGGEHGLGEGCAR